jgi:hypothetical protein
MEIEVEPLRPGELINDLKDAAGSLGGDLLRYAVVAVVALVALYILWKLLRRRPGKLPLVEPDLTIDVATLGTAGPPAGAPVLEHYHVPMRLAAVALAPAGRVHPLPPPDQLAGVFEAITPGLAQVVATHNTLVRCWPGQLSISGFAHVFFRYVRLPGDGGKGTQWCSAAGLVKVRGQPVMAGLLMFSRQPNSIGQMIVEHETKWLDILRVKPPQ